MASEFEVPFLNGTLDSTPFKFLPHEDRFDILQMLYQILFLKEFLIDEKFDKDLYLGLLLFTIVINQKWTTDSFILIMDEYCDSESVSELLDGFSRDLKKRNKRANKLVVELLRDREIVASAEQWLDDFEEITSIISTNSNQVTEPITPDDAERVTSAIETVREYFHERITMVGQYQIATRAEFVITQDSTSGAWTAEKTPYFCLSAQYWFYLVEQRRFSALDARGIIVQQIQKKFKSKRRAEIYYRALKNRIQRFGGDTPEQKFIILKSIYSGPGRRIRSGI